VALTLVERGLIIASGTGSTALLGDLLMLAAVFAGVWYGVMAKKPLTRYKSVAVSAYAMLAGALLLAPVAVFESLATATFQARPQTMWAVLFVGIAGGAIGFFLWTNALVRLSPTQVSVYVNLNPMVATLLGTTLLGEQLTPMFLVGLVAVIGGVLLVNLPVARR
jgi:drug/metabolite transporter (DMT)-like permease